MFTMPMVELAGLLVVVLFISAGLVLWMKRQKRKPHPMMQVLMLVVLLALGLFALKWGGEQIGMLPAPGEKVALENPYRQAFVLLQQPYPAYTSINNIASANREELVTRFTKMEQLSLADLKPRVSRLRELITSAPASGQTGVYNMLMTSEIQARWNELQRAVQERLK